MKKENIFDKEIEDMEELEKRIELLEKAVEIKDKKIEYLEELMNIQAEGITEITEKTGAYISQLEEALGDLL